MDDWYGGGADFDVAVRDLAADWLAALRSQPAETFLTDPDTALAATILFDQVPRNIFRGSAEAFATDDLARQIARGIVAQGWDQHWPDARRQFAYLPFEHSEDIADQRRSLRLMSNSPIRSSTTMRRSISTSSTVSDVSRTAMPPSAAQRVPMSRRR